MWYLRCYLGLKGGSSEPFEPLLNPPLALHDLQACMADIHTWMLANKLKLIKVEQNVDSYMYNAGRCGLEESSNKTMMADVFYMNYIDSVV